MVKFLIYGFKIAREMKRLNAKEIKKRKWSDEKQTLALILTFSPREETESVRRQSCGWRSGLPGCRL
jgi:hypothetical protein